MELRQLTHFLAVARRRHFTKAAKDLHLTQSSLSSSIRALERELGGDLFVRSTRRVELTEAGRALLPDARRAVEAAEAGRDAVAGVHGLLRGTLTVGAIQTLGMVDLPAVLTRYHRRHPAVGLRVRHDSVRGLVHATVTGELDLAFVDRPLGPDAERVRAYPLGGESLVLAVAANDPLAHRAKVRIAELGDADFVEYRADSALRASIDAAAREAGLRRRVCCEVDTITDQVELVANGLGVALLPPLALRTAGERVAGVPTEPAIGREQVVVLARDREPSQAVLALLALLPSLRDATS